LFATALDEDISFYSHLKGQKIRVMSWLMASLAVIWIRDQINKIILLALTTQKT
jgi:hypothetical protein